MVPAKNMQTGAIIMEQLDIQRQVITIIRKQCADSGVLHGTQPITAETAIQKDLEFDSIMLVVLQIEIEDLFRIRFNPAEEDFRQIFSTVGTLCASIQSHIETDYEN